ncbi:MAG TPA: TlpA disulfide reductase family protein [Chitinophagales bacterium]|nr:TlpA disulfide reductase family protein [Chitinophagales bacterium]
MRNILLILSVVFVALSCKPDKDAFVIQGTIKDLKEPFVYLIHPAESGQQIDTLEVKNGSFKIKGKVTTPNLYLLAFGEEYMPVEIFLEPGKFNISGDLNDIENVQVEGGVLQSTYNNFFVEMDPVNKNYLQLYDELLKAKEDSNLIVEDSLNYQLDSVKDLYYEKSYQFVEKQPVSIVSAKLIAEILMAYPDIDRLEPIVGQFNAPVRNSSYGQKIVTTLNTIKKTRIGTIAPNFTLKDVEGNEISLEKYHGKYVLIDFWAAWCAPCREENPRMVAIYNKFKGRKFDMLGVSIDHNLDQWKKAVIKDQLAWAQLVDDQNISNHQYGIISIPANVLVDPEGVIIAKNIFGRKLEAQLQEVLNLK